MAYQKTTWQTGDIITAEKLNNIQNGIESSIFVMSGILENFDPEGENYIEFNKTYGELLDAINTHKPIIVIREVKVPHDQYPCVHYDVAFISDIMIPLDVQPGDYKPYKLYGPIISMDYLTSKMGIFSKISINFTDNQLNEKVQILLQ